MKDLNYILWLPSWYPNKLEPLCGDFIQRHAKAVSLTELVHVIYVVKDVQGVRTTTVCTELNTEGNLTETIIYYHIARKKIKVIEKWLSFIKFFSLYKKAIKECLSKQGKPGLIQVYIAFKTGIIALWAKRQFKIPYVLSEQWTLYLPGAKPNFCRLPLFTRLIYKKIFRQAASVMVVSDYLGRQIQRLFDVSKPVLIPNVVDSTVFSYVPTTERAVKRFVHISTLSYQKNPEAMMEAFFLVKEQGYAFVLDVIGPERPALRALTEQYGLNENVFFHCEMPQQQLAVYLQKADALVLFSRYETFGCVVIEANACGVPVIVSDIPVFHENITNGFNGLFAASEEALSLSGQIIYLMNNKNLFKNKEIAIHTAETYNYKQIGAKFTTWYTHCLSETQKIQTPQ